ncbi:hypothetical protein HPB52_001916 [Rhipicephalus sanguineus]|uniref:Uncharacterized protein n=1 Tax=Rhipicephalus sanguineus TaxID=34632 RepID=A0A9D4QFG3_RHISA|nr:hypothetical protein HPB52_001916 [Rhipicephalus sanguineus]
MGIRDENIEEAVVPIPEDVIEELEALREPPPKPPNSVAYSDLVYVGGYIAKLITDVGCETCAMLVTTNKTSSPYHLLRQQEAYDLHYPKPELLSMLDTFVTFFEKAVKYLPRTKILETLQLTVEPYLKDSPLLDGPEAGKDPSKEERLLQNYMKMASQVTEFLWQHARVSCQVREKQNEALHNVTVLGNKTLPAKVEVLNKGPKYSYEPRKQRHQLLAMVRTVADRAAKDDKGRLVGDSVASLKRTVSHKLPKKPPFRDVKCLEENNLSVLQADKDGGFLVKPKGMFREKAWDAVQKNFKCISFDPKECKKLAVRKLSELHLDGLRRAV